MSVTTKSKFSPFSPSAPYPVHVLCLDLLFCTFIVWSGSMERLADEVDARDRFGKGRKAGNLLRDIMAGVELNAPHRGVILAMANSLRSLGADLVLGEAAVVTSTLRRSYSHVDLVASYAGLTWGFEVDWKTIKWRSIQKLMSFEHDVSVFVLRHPRPNLGGSLARLKLVLGRG